MENMLKEDLSVIIPDILGSELGDKATYRPLCKGPEAEAQPIIAADFLTADFGSVWFTAPLDMVWMTTKLAWPVESRRSRQ
jgi:hypothetical protein